MKVWELKKLLEFSNSHNDVIITVDGYSVRVSSVYASPCANSRFELSGDLLVDSTPADLNVVIQNSAQ